MRIGAGPARRIDRPVRAAVVVHIYYEDTWLDFAAVLKRVPIPFDLIVLSLSLIEEDPLKLASSFRAADATHAARLERAEQFGLRGDRQLADLVQK